MSNRPIIRRPKTAAFLGIAEGKQARAKADAQIALINAQAAADAAKAKAERDTLTLQLAQAQAGFTPDKDKAAANLKLAQTAAVSENTIYYVLAAVVVAVLVGIYFIKKR